MSRGTVAFLSLLAIIWIFVLMILPNPTWLGQLPTYLKVGIGLSSAVTCCLGVVRWINSYK